MMQSILMEKAWQQDELQLWLQESEAAGHIVTIVRKDGVMNPASPLMLFLLLNFGL